MRLGWPFAKKTQILRSPTEQYLPGFYGGSPFGQQWISLLSTTEFDYRSAAGLPWDCGVISTVLNWIATQLSEADLRLQSRSEQGWENVLGGPLPALLKSMNPAGTNATVGSIALSLKMAGNAYLYIDRSLAGRPAALWYVPHNRIGPEARDKRWISHYAYVVDGKKELWPVENVIHLRNPVLDPNEPRLGRSPIVAHLRDICAYNEAASYAASILRNMGIVGAFVSPKTSDLGDQGPTDEQVGQMQAQWKAKFAQESRGGLLIAPFPMELSIPGMTPKDSALAEIRRTMTASLCGALGVDPIALGMPSESKTYANYKEAREGATENCLVPLWNQIGTALSEALLPEFGFNGDDYRIAFDISNVRSLQEDINKIHQRAREDYGYGVITRNEARIAAGYERVDGGDEFIKTGKEGVESPDEDESRPGRRPNGEE